MGSIKELNGFLSHQQRIETEITVNEKLFIPLFFYDLFQNVIESSHIMYTSILHMPIMVVRAETQRCS